MQYDRRNDRNNNYNSNYNVGYNSYDNYDYYWNDNSNYWYGRKGEKKNKEDIPSDKSRANPET